jgi:hypothetical protein
VIGNHPSFFFYLTAAVQNPPGTSAPRLNGVLDYTISHPLVYAPGEWVEAGRPLRPVVVLLQGVPFFPGQGEMENVQRWLSERCRLTDTDRYVADPGYAWKQKYRPEFGQGPWRIDIRSYSCPEEKPSISGH